VGPIQDGLANDPAAQLDDQEVDLASLSASQVASPFLTLPFRPGPGHRLDIPRATVTDRRLFKHGRDHARSGAWPYLEPVRSCAPSGTPVAAHGQSVLGRGRSSVTVTSMTTWETGLPL
jgi:hypothetical protein